MRLNKVEIDRIHEFHWNHRDCEYNNQVSVKPSNDNGIGTVITVKCTVCKEKLDVSDYASW